MKTAQQIIYEGAGRPDVLDPEGAPLPKDDYGVCAYCRGKAVYRLKSCLSSNFVVCKQMALGAAGLCEACAFCLRDLRLRCAPWIAREDGVRFCLDRWGILDFLTHPPEPPFVAGLPWFGMSKGGQKNWQFARVWHPDREEQLLCPAKIDEKTGEVLREPQVLGKLQSKHTAIFAKASVSRDCYPLAIDDTGIVEVDVALWRRLGTLLTEALLYLPVPCLEEWKAPEGGAQWEHGIIHWRALTAPLEPYREAQWWPLLLAIVPRPERPEVEKLTQKPAPKPESKPKREEPPARNVAKPERSGQLALF
jgi:hypothetical protein